MTTWANLDTSTQYLLDDTGQMYWTTGASGEVRRELEAAELLIGLIHGLTEYTVTFSLSASTSLYNIASTLTDYVTTLRVSNALAVPLRRTTYAALTRLDDQHRVVTGTPECWYPLGGTQIGFYPAPSANTTVELTYLRVPPTAQSSGSPVIADEWHDAMPEYAAAVLKASEGKITEATELLKSFLEKVGMKRFVRLLRGASFDKPESAIPPQREQLD